MSFQWSPLQNSRQCGYTWTNCQYASGFVLWIVKVDQQQFVLGSFLLEIVSGENYYLTARTLKGAQDKGKEYGKRHCHAPAATVQVSKTTCPVLIGRSRQPDTPTKKKMNRL